MSQSSGVRGTVQSGRETAGVLLKSAQLQLRKVFIVFLVGLFGTVYFMRKAGWRMLRNVTTAKMNAATAEQFDVIVRTPFDVILLQVKLGLAAGILLSLPPLGYYARKALIERDRWPFSVSRAKALLVFLLSTVLFIAGISYAYFIFFPVIFNFLTEYTIKLGFEPTYDIVKWTQFILFLTLSFGLAAQLPLAMSGLSYAGLVPYEFFRDRWRHATVIIFVFGAVFSPPDPFTQIMWGVPLLILYGISLYLTKLVTAIKRGGSAMVRAKLRRNWYKVAAPFGLAAAATGAFLRYGGLAWVETTLLPLVPAGVRPGGLSIAAVPGAGTVEVAIAAVAVGVVLALPFLIYYAWPELQPRGSTGDPYDIDLSELDAEGVRAAPVEAFADLSESDAVDRAREAMDDDDDEKARAILDRFDEAEAELDDDEADAEDAGDRSVKDVAGDTLLNVGDTLTDEETDEDDLGGYAYDAAFILDSLTSKSFRVVAVFMAATMATFFALYGGAFKAIRADFFSRLPPVLIEEVNVVALHPVEALLFEVKMSLLVGIVATLPAVCYYIWPAVEERFYGITREYETPPPGTAVRRQWNKVAAFFVLGAAGTYLGLTKYAAALPVALPDGNVSVGAVTLTPTMVLYLAAAAAGVLVASPVVSYYAWPSLRERWAGSKRTAFLQWAGLLVGGLAAGSIVGYLYVAPWIISYLVVDALQAGMVIKYTINQFFWLIFLTTVGIGLLAEIPMTMWLFHRTGVVSYRTMRDRWRGVVFVVFVAAALLTDRSVVSMFLFGIPVSLMYWFGLAGIYVAKVPQRALRRVGVGA